MKKVLPLMSRAPWVLWLGRLRHPTLFKLAMGLLAVSWLLPDPIPLLDELLFTALAMALANWKRSRPSAVQSEVTDVRIHNVPQGAG